MKTQEIEISIGLIKINSSYVCLKRNLSPYKNFIEFPGGKKNIEETISSCLVREIKEELNISLKKYKYIGFIKHLYNDVLIKINIFKIFKYSGEISSNENRNIIFYNNESDFSVLPTHKRILNILRVPKVLKIFNFENFLHDKNLNLSSFNYIRLRDIPYSVYKETIKQRLKVEKYTGKIIIDYPYNKDWHDRFHGIHYNSSNIENFNSNERDDNCIYSASCHTENDINECNLRLFDFILLSPLLEKHNKFNALGWSKFNKLSLKSYSPTIALGGLSSNGYDYNDCIEHSGFGIAGIRKI